MRLLKLGAASVARIANTATVTMSSISVNPLAPFTGPDGIPAPCLPKAMCPPPARFTALHATDQGQGLPAPPDDWQESGRGRSGVALSCTDAPNSRCPPRSEERRVGKEDT